MHAPLGDGVMASRELRGMGYVQPRIRSSYLFTALGVRHIFEGFQSRCISFMALSDRCRSILPNIEDTRDGPFRLLHCQSGVLVLTSAVQEAGSTTPKILTLQKSAVSWCLKTW